MQQFTTFAEARESLNRIRREAESELEGNELDEGYDSLRELRDKLIIAESGMASLEDALSKHPSLRHLAGGDDAALR